MEPSKEAIAVRITRLNRQILGKVTSGTTKFNKRTIDRETLFDALSVLYDDCNDDPIKKSDEVVKAFVDKYRSTLAELRRTRVCFSDFEVLQTIGRGHFGEVHMVREKQTGDVYALKTLRKEQAWKRAAGATDDERDVLATSTSAWIPKLQYAFQDSSNLYLVMELCSGGDLAGLLARRSNPLSERDAAFYVAEVAHALKALHGMGYVHRDVKPHNIFLDRCGHVKLGDFGSCARLSGGGAGAASLAAGTPDYVAPELLAAAHCAARHTVCLEYCRGIVNTAISACDYWSLGVVAFELVTLKRPFSTGDEDSIAQILSNIQKYERSPDAEPPFECAPRGPSREWRALVAGLLRVPPARRYSYLDTLQHPALASHPLHAIREQVPPWVPCIRGSEDASHFSPPARVAPQPSATPFRSRPPFAGQLPFIGYSFVAPEESEDTTGGFNASHDCTAIDLATFKSAEKLATMRAREIVSLQNKLSATEAAAEAAAAAAGERARRDADAEAERTRARLQAEITALSLQNRRLERQVEVEKEERMALQRTNQELASGITERKSAELRATQVQVNELQTERDSLKDDMRRLEERVVELKAECARALADADNARTQQQHYKDTIAKERALRRQTLSGEEAERREAAAAASAAAARETRARQQLEERLAAVLAENNAMHAQLDHANRELSAFKESVSEKNRAIDTSTTQLQEVQVQLSQERMRVNTLLAQVQECERSVDAAARREAALEEQCARTEARLHERLRDADARVAAALLDDARHRDKVNTLEQLVRQLERDVSALEGRNCPACEARAEDTSAQAVAGHAQSHSDTESVGEAAHAQLALLKEQLERAEAQLQSRAEEIATLRQEARTANLARWRKEREFNELSVESKSTTRDLKRTEERLSAAIAKSKAAEQKVTALQKEIETLRPQHDSISKELERVRERLEKLQKTHETTQAEVDRSRNDIRKLKCELQYSEKRRLHAEEQEELSSRERAQLREELTQLRTQNNDLVQNNKALQEACSLLEEQLNDLEKLADLHEVKNKDLESETKRTRSELESCRARLSEAEKLAAERAAAAALAAQQHDEAKERADHTQCQLQLLKERLDSREAYIAEVESRAAAAEGARASAEAALAGASRRLRELHDECAAVRTRAHQHAAHALQLQAELAATQEEVSAAHEAAEAAAAWWRTRETKADATLRQQAKLIDFLQAKVEEAGRKKCSLSNKLFGRSGRRTAASPPLRRANRELREEVERLRAKLAAINASGDYSYPPTPRREKCKPKQVNGTSIDAPDAAHDSMLQIVWSDGSRECLCASVSDGVLVLSAGGKQYRAYLLSAEANNLPQNELDRAFTIKLDNCDKGSVAAVVCANVSERARWVSAVGASPAGGYAPTPLAALAAEPLAALYLAPNAIAIGCSDGLHSLRGTVSFEVHWSRAEDEGSGVGADAGVGAGAGAGAVRCVAACGARALAAAGGALLHAAAAALSSALRRSSALRPAVRAAAVPLPDTAEPHLIRSISGETSEGACVAVACGRRVFLLRFDAVETEFKITRSLTVDRSPSSLLLTNKTLYVAGEKPLKINLPSGMLESFAMDEPTVAAAARKHSPPRAILLIREKPVEILLCYAECGVFVDEKGKRTRNEDPKWSSAVHGWEFVNPFLYVIGDDVITILYISEEAYRAPPCTCDTTSLASTASDCYYPEIFKLKIKEPLLLGTAPNGIIVRSKVDDGYSISIIEGMAAFKSVGASIESLETIESKGSSLDLALSYSELSPYDASQESVEPNTGFLADIRKRARQLRTKNRIERTSDDVIKEILTTEIGLKRTSHGRKSPATISEFDSDSNSDTTTESTKGTADLCAEMFTRQVRFQH